MSIESSVRAEDNARSASAGERLDGILERLDAERGPRPAADQAQFDIRLKRRFHDLHDSLERLYGERADFQPFLTRLVLSMQRAWEARPAELKTLDFERDLTPDWFQRESMLGYVFYVENFAGTLKGVHEHLDYLAESGATYVHLMKVLQAREGENDGGYAIVDYKRVEPALGCNRDLAELCKALRERGMSVCIDLVLNHCAREHAWAAAAREGDAHHRDYFHHFEDRTLPERFEQTLPEVFPDFAPGNFTWDGECERWIWTTFNDYQWDLNWSNPEVFLEIVDIMQTLANLGVEVLRLDAVAFLWKRLGTDSQNQEEVFDLLQALRACSRIATPALAHKAEAIVSPDDLIRYLGVGKRHGRVSDIAYHNALMVHFWSALASRDTRLMTHALGEFPRTPSSAAWATYVRCHDDIGWAIADDDAAAVGIDAGAHRAFLSDYYTGVFPGSHARGTVFQHNPETGDRRVNGSLASLAGLEFALEQQDERLITLAIERILLGHALIAGHGGLPLLYMGDEIGLLSDASYAQDPSRADDSRWAHRPRMDWARAARRHQPGTLESRLYQGIARIVSVRRSLPHLHASIDTDIIDTAHASIFACRRQHPIGTFVALYNMTEERQYLPLAELGRAGLSRPNDRLSDQPPIISGGFIVMAPYARLWLTERTALS